MKGEFIYWVVLIVCIITLCYFLSSLWKSDIYEPTNHPSGTTKVR